MKRLLLLLLLIPLLAAQTTPAIDVSAEPSHHVVLENDYVRVLKVEIAPQTATLLHRHSHDYVYVALGDSHFSNEVEGKPPVDVSVADGEVRFTQGNFAHVVKNLMDQPFRVVAVEFMQGDKLRHTSSYWPEESAEKLFPGGSRKILFVKDGVRVSEFNLAPGAAVPSYHYPGPHLTIALIDLDLRRDVPAKARPTAGWRPDISHGRRKPPPTR